MPCGIQHAEPDSLGAAKGSIDKDRYGGDVPVDGLLRCLDRDSEYEVFNVGTSTPLPIRVWLAAIAKAYGNEVKYQLIDADSADVVASADISRTASILGYCPQVDMFEGVKRQVAVFRLMPAWYQTMENV